MFELGTKLGHVIYGLNEYVIVAAAKEETTTSLQAAVLSTCRDTVKTCTSNTNKTYAAALGSPKQPSPSAPLRRKDQAKQKKTTETVLLFSKAQKVKHLMKKINPATAQLKIHRISSIPDKGVAVEVENAKQAETLIASLGDGFTARSPQK